MTDPKNRRKFQRIVFPSYLSLSLSGSSNGVYQGVLQDISFNGVLAKIENSPDNLIGRSGELTIVPEQAEFSLNFSVDILHRLPAQPNVTALTYGMQISQMDIDTAGHLRRLIELNLSDNASLQRELHQLLEDQLLAD
ncbi:PilZ domain-containing protein [Reinekea thalattae]|uniref:PilZ domain-containing protein n=1 Tax=Reinekea thalattae TaxID=2593301 RepID=A0A5C8Z412_9GAMM|nr:PilZ domain-containing protein [Reinekea thalattae]TXR51963.1 PilZ domain-containing protein [Reinekea thalattae]